MGRKLAMMMMMVMMMTMVMMMIMMPMKIREYTMFQIERSEEARASEQLSTGEMIGTLWRYSRIISLVKCSKLYYILLHCDEVHCPTTCHYFLQGR